MCCCSCFFCNYCYFSSHFLHRRRSDWIKRLLLTVHNAIQPRYTYLLPRKNWGTDKKGLSIRSLHHSVFKTTHYCRYPGSYNKRFILCQVYTWDLYRDLYSLISCSFQRNKGTVSESEEADPSYDLVVRILFCFVKSDLLSWLKRKGIPFKRNLHFILPLFPVV